VFTHKHIKPAGGNMSLYGGINNKERYISGMFGTIIKSDTLVECLGQVWTSTKLNNQCQTLLTTAKNIYVFFTAGNL